MNGLTQKVAESGWAPVIGIALWGLARVIGRAFFPTGYYFRFMRRILVRDEAAEDES